MLVLAQVQVGPLTPKSLHPQLTEYLGNKALIKPRYSNQYAYQRADILKEKDFRIMRCVGFVPGPGLFVDSKPKVITSSARRDTMDTKLLLICKHCKVKTVQIKYIVHRVLGYCGHGCGSGQGVHFIYQLLLFPFHLFSLTLFLLLCFIVGEKTFKQKSPKNELKLK